MVATGRVSGPERVLRPFHIYCDEAHRFVPGSLEDLLSDARRSAVSLTLAHQCTNQFHTHITSALTDMGTTVIFRVSRKDAEAAAEDLQGKLSADELIALEMGQAVARIGGHVVRLETLPPLTIPQHHFRDEIIARCHQRYYLPSERILRALR